MELSLVSHGPFRDFFKIILLDDKSFVCFKIKSCYLDEDKLRKNIL